MTVYALPILPVANGQLRQSPAFSAPLNTFSVTVEVDGAAWPVGTQVRVKTEVSEDGGGTWVPHGAITANNESLLNGKCRVGLRFGSGNTNSNYQVRASVEVLAGPGIILVGSVTVE